MATPAPGTIPALPQYQPGALPLTGGEILEIASNATATAAISAYMPLTDVVGKTPSVMVAANPSANDLIAFYQKASGLPKQCSIANLGIPSGNLPTGGTTGQILAKNSATNFDDSWYSLSTFLVAGTGLTTAGSTTVTVGIANFGVGSAQIATGAVGSTQIATNSVGNAQFRQSAPLSVVGVAGTATANVADISASGGGLVLQTNTAGTGLIWSAINVASAIFTGVLGVPTGGTGTSALTAHAVLLGAGSGTLQFAPAVATGNLLIDQGSGNNPAFTPVAGDVTISAAGTTTIGNNKITYAKMQQGTGLSVLGVAGTAVANFSALVAGTSQILGVGPGGTTLGFTGAPVLSTSITVGTSVTGLGTIVGYRADNQSLLAINQLVTGVVGAQNWNYINIPSDQVTGVFMADFSINHVFGGGASAGARVGAIAFLQQTSPTNASNTNRSYTGMAGVAQTELGDGGTNATSGALGTYFGANFVARNGGTAIYELTACEMDVMNTATSTQTYNFGMTVANFCAKQAGSADAGIAFYSGGAVTANGRTWGPGIGFNQLLMVGEFGGAGLSPINATSTIFGTHLETLTNFTANYGIDFRKVTFSSGAFASPGYLVDGGGLINSAGFTATVTNFNTTTTNLAAIPNLSVSVATGVIYAFDARIYVSCGSTGGAQVSMFSSGNATTVIYDVEAYGPAALISAQRATSIPVGVTASNITTPTFQIAGTYVGNGGTLSVLAAQAVSTTATTIVLPGSFLRVMRMN